MGDIIRASDIENNSDEIKLPEGVFDHYKDEDLSKKEDINNEEEKKEEVKDGDEISKEDVPDDNKHPEDIKDEEKEKIEEQSEPNIKDLSDEELDAMSDEELDKLLSDIEEDQSDKTEDIDKDSSEGEIDFALKEKDALLKSVSDRLESKIRENAELKVQLAEKAIFSGDGKEELMLFNTNMAKVKDGDESAKEKALSFLDKMRKEITGKTFGEADIDKDTDIISNSNSIKPGTEPSKPSTKELEEQVKVL